MRSAALYLLSIFLLLSLVACSSKTADTASNSQNTAAPSNPAASDATNGAAAPATTSGSPNASAPATQSAPATPVAPPPVVVPAGTVLTVRLEDAVGSRISSPGDIFRATLASPVAVDGNTVIPVGASVRGTVVDAKPLGKIKGGAVLEIRLTSITVNGTLQSIETASIERQEKGKGKRTAAFAGGGAALGGIIGGIAGGGKGAAIGLLAGGAAGTGGAAYTGNKEIVFPVESKLSFKLKSPIQVNPMS
ncbi:MAG: hypothetical protein WA718_01385 [Terriglobales bacterium]